MSAFDAILSSDENEMLEMHVQVTSGQLSPLGFDSAVNSWSASRAQSHDSRQDFNAFNLLANRQLLEQLLDLHKDLLKQYFSGRDDNSDQIMRRSEAPDPTLLEFIDSMANVLRDHDEYWKQVQGEEVERALEPLQDWLDLAPATHPYRRGALYLLVKLSAKVAKFPPQLYTIGVDLGLAGSRDPVAHGGFADVYRGVYRGRPVAVKRLRINADSKMLETQARFCREALVWRQLDHPSILRFIGIDGLSFVTSQHICLVAPWMDNGTLADFVRSTKYDAHTDFYRLLHEIAQGLEYLHSQLVVHGDINDVNVLVDDNGKAKLCDFGLAIVGSTTTGNMTTTDSGAGTIRFMSPERFLSEETRRTMSDDVYAFACLCYTLVTGHHPFHNTNRFQVGMLVLNGQRPSRPGKEEQKIYLSDCIWSLIDISWREHTIRPSMREIGVAFKLLYNGSFVPDSPINLADLFNEANKSNPRDAEAIRLLCKLGGVRLSDKVVALDHGIRCNNCDNFIVGVRYQCASCSSLPDAYNLCASCEPISYMVHNAVHVFFKLPRPVDRPLESEKPFLPWLYKKPVGSVNGHINAAHPSEYLESLLHIYVACDVCMERIKGPWYWCVYCDKDLCDAHEAVDTHDPTHVFVVFKAEMDTHAFTLFKSTGSVLLANPWEDSEAHPWVMPYPVYDAFLP